MQNYTFSTIYPRKINTFSTLRYAKTYTFSMIGDNIGDLVPPVAVFWYRRFTLSDFS